MGLEHVSEADLRNVDSGPEEFQMFPHLLWFVLGVEDGQLREDAHVSSFQTYSATSPTAPHPPTALVDSYK